MCMFLCLCVLRQPEIHFSFSSFSSWLRFHQTSFPLVVNLCQSQTPTLPCFVEIKKFLSKEHFNRVTLIFEKVFLCVYVLCTQLKKISSFFSSRRKAHDQGKMRDRKSERERERERERGELNFINGTL